VAAQTRVDISQPAQTTAWPVLLCGPGVDLHGERSGSVVVHRYCTPLLSDAAQFLGRLGSK
jgi:hypothetical protein